jgi:GT2 family glycosyltransferase
MKIAIVIVNYAGCDVTLKCYNSVSDDARKKHTVDFFVINNFFSTTDENSLKLKFSDKAATLILLPENIGYFPALNVGLAKIRSDGSRYDYIIIGNNDLLFSNSFFNRLGDRKYNSDVVVVAPRIVTLTGVNQNPHIKDGISRFREIFYDIYYSNFYLALLVSVFVRLVGGVASRSDQLSASESCYIRTGFGACYLLTPRFFEIFDGLWAPTFLMGEELMLGRQLFAYGRRVFFDCELSVCHVDNQTIGKVPKRHTWGYAKQSHRVYREFISPYRRLMESPVDSEWGRRCSGKPDIEVAVDFLRSARILDRG